MITAADILTEWHRTASDLASPHLNRAAAALHAGDRARAAGELELAASHYRGEDGERLCRMAIDLVGQPDLATISGQALDLSWRDAWRHELRGPHGEWVKSPVEALVAAPASKLAGLRDGNGGWVHDNDVLEKAATGRRAGGARKGDYILYGVTIPDPTGFGYASDLRPTEITALHHSWEGHGKKRHRLTTITTGYGDETMRDGSSVKILPREDVRKLLRAEQRGHPLPAPPRPAPVPHPAPAPKPRPLPPEFLPPGSWVGIKPEQGQVITMPDPDGSGRTVKVTRSAAPGHVHVAHADGKAEDVPAAFVEHPTAPNRFTGPVPVPAPVPAPRPVPVDTGKHAGSVTVVSDDVIPDPAQRAAAIAEARHALDLQDKFVPKIAENQLMTFTSDLGDTTNAETLYGEEILLNPYNARAVGNVTKTIKGLTPDDLQKRDEGMGWWVPSDPQYSLMDTTVAHEEGHVIADKVSRKAMMSLDLWDPLAKAVGVPPPATFRDILGGHPTIDLAEWVQDHQAQLKTAVSEYGTTNLPELQAELWSEYTMNADPRPPAKIYGDYITAQLKAAGKL